MMPLVRLLGKKTIWFSGKVVHLPTIYDVDKSSNES